MSMTIRIPLRFDSSAIPEIPSIFLSFYEVCDRLDQLALIDLIGDLGDDDTLVVVVLLDLAAAADDDTATTGSQKASRTPA